MHAAVDDFSRRILAWIVADKGNGLNTVEILKAALDRLDAPVESVEVMVDGGSENALFDASVLEGVLARVDVVYSNSMIEAFWRSLRHQWLYLHYLNTVDAVRRLSRTT